MFVLRLTSTGDGAPHVEVVDAAGVWPQRRTTRLSAALRTTVFLRPRETLPPWEWGQAQWLAARKPASIHRFWVNSLVSVIEGMIGVRLDLCQAIAIYLL